MDSALRRPTPDDWSVVAAMQADARLALAEARGGREWLGANPAFTDADDGSDEPRGRRERLATLDGVVVGHAISTRRGTVVTVDWLYVDPGARELGLGEALLDDAIDWARSIGAETIESVALPGDRETKNMFERFGMKARLLVVTRRLDADPELGGDGE